MSELVWRRKRERGENKFYYLSEAWKELYEKGKDSFTAKEIRKKYKLNSAETKVLIIRRLFESLPGKTFEEKRKNYNKLREENILVNFREVKGRVKTDFDSRGLARFIGITSMKGKPYVMKVYEEMAGVREIENRFLKELEKLKKDPDYISKMNQEAKTFVKILDSLGIVEIEYKGNKFAEVSIVKKDSFDKVLKTRYIPWPDLNKLALKSKIKR